MLTLITRLEEMRKGGAHVNKCLKVAKCRERIVGRPRILDFINGKIK